jgi:hypothetical protein
VIKNVKTDKSEGTIELVGTDLMMKLVSNCQDGPSTCIHMDELNQRVDAANAVLAKDRWRPFPCFIGLKQPDRKEPGCEHFFETKTDFEDARLRVSHRGRLLLDVRKPTWVYRDPSRGCKSTERTELQSEAFDPATGIYVVGLGFWAMVEGCDEPIWDFHPIRLPALRSKPARGRDGGAP